MEPILYALREYGTLEFDVASNPQVEKYLKTCKGNASDDSVPWCSAFVNWCAKQASAQRSNSLSARSWLKVGKPVKTPKFGDVVVFWRGSKDDKVTGHVAFFISYNPNGTINVIGGNQGNAVNINAYPPSKLLGAVRIY